MSGRVRTRKAVKIAYYIMNCSNGRVFTAADVQAWWFSDHPCDVPSVREICRIVSWMELEKFPPANYLDRWSYRVRYDGHGQMVPPYVVKPIVRAD